MLQDQVIPISLDGGIDTKTNPKVVVAGKFLFVENGIYTNPGEVEKRNGYTAIPSAIVGGGNISAPKMVRGFNGELICQDSGSIYGYSPSLQAWVNKGPYTSVEISETFLFKQASVGGFVDCAVLGNYALYVWSTDSSTGTITTVACVIDLQTGAPVYGPVTLSSFPQPPDALTSTPRAVVVGGTKLAVAYANSTVANYVLQFLNISTGSIAFDGVEHTLFSIGGPTFLTTTLPVDFVSTASGAAIAYSFGGILKVATISTSGAVSTPYSYTLTDTAGVYPVALSLESGTGNLWVYFGDDSNASNTAFVKYAVLSSALSVVLAPITVTGLTSLPNNTIMNLAALPVSSTQQTLYAGTLYSDAGSGQTIDRTYAVTVSSSGTIGSLSLRAIGAFPISHPFTVGGKNYMVFVYRGPSVAAGLTVNPQPTFFVLDLGTGSVVARFAAGSAKSEAVLVGGYCGSVALASLTRAIFCCGIEYENLLNNAFVGGLVGAASVTIDFGSSRSYRATPAGETLILNGGLVSMYDGQASVELGFGISPEIVKTITGTVAGTGISTGTYSYIAVFQWVDAQGNMHQSAGSLPVKVTFASGTNNKTTLYVTMAYLSAKQNVNVAIFRTKNNGTVYYQVTDPIAVQASVAANYILSFADSMPDTNAGVDLSSKLQLYTNGNVVENSPPPPSMIMEPRINRLYMVDSENPNSIWYTKSFTPGTGVSPSGLLQIQIDSKLGNISGLAAMDDKMIVPKDRGFFWFSGDGANDTGTGSTLTLPQDLPMDQGCNSLKSLIMTPNGLFFKGPKGIHLLDRSLQSHYIGAEVEKWNAQSITAATMVADKSQIRFLTDSGVTLVYDYIFSKWSYFTNHQGVSADNFQGAYTYSRTDGSIFQENQTSFLDNATDYRLRARLGWLAMAGVQGFERVRRLGLLGDYSNGTGSGHGIQISAAYDYVESFLAAVAYLFGASGSAGTFQYRERLIQQKCESLSLLIEEITTGQSGESIALTNLSLEAGVKRGINKLPASRSVS